MVVSPRQSIPRLAIVPQIRDVSLVKLDAARATAFYERGRSAHPSITVPRERLTSISIVPAWARWRGRGGLRRDLYLACACSLGDRRALHAFETDSCRASSPSWRGSSRARLRLRGPADGAHATPRPDRRARAGHPGLWRPGPLRAWLPRGGDPLPRARSRSRTRGSSRSERAGSADAGGTRRAPSATS